MAMRTPFASAEHHGARRWQLVGDVELATDFGDPAAEYTAATTTAALFDRSDRGRLAVLGTEARAWLHNVVTNAVRDLRAGAGVYAFCADVRGRIQFDLNALAIPAGLWLDVDHSRRAQILAHLDRFLFTEDARLEDCTAADARLGIAGPQAATLAARLGIPDLATWSPLRHAPLPNDPGHILRHDFAGVLGFELIVPAATAAQWWDRLAAADARPAGYTVLDTLRIEAGLPWLGRDLDDQVLPPETGQADRAIAHNKGCYTGHEVIERMRSRDVLPRQLVRLEAASDLPADFGLPAPLHQHDQQVGRVTSLVRHPAQDRAVGLAYLKTGLKDFDGLQAGDLNRAVPVRVV
jgi:folate-binding protein YgfZ